jgi:hypothetical protein
MFSINCVQFSSNSCLLDATRLKGKICTRISGEKPLRLNELFFDSCSAAIIIVQYGKFPSPYWVGCSLLLILDGSDT